MKPPKTATKPRGKSAEKPAVIATVRELTMAAASPTALLAEVRSLILETRQKVAQGVNSALVMLYWQIGQRIRANILKQKRAEYGEKIFYALSRKLDSAQFSSSAHAAMRSVSGGRSWRRYLCMIFARSGAKDGTEKNTGMVDRSALATINSEGGIAGFMVRSQLRKQRQTSAV